VGSCVGLSTFIGGVGLLIIVFRMAYDMFNLPPSAVLGLSKGKTIDLAYTGNSLLTVILRVTLLLVMGLVGSWIANRGISLYTQARSVRMTVDE
jgi:hypothetical protein